MSGKAAAKRRHAVAKRCARLRQQHLSLSEIAEATGIERDKVATNIQLGERLLSLESAR